jgi:hypothetical protein
VTSTHLALSVILTRQEEWDSGFSTAMGPGHRKGKARMGAARKGGLRHDSCHSAPQRCRIAVQIARPKLGKSTQDKWAPRVHAKIQATQNQDSRAVPGVVGAALVRQVERGSWLQIRGTSPGGLKLSLKR